MGGRVDGWVREADVDRWIDGSMDRGSGYCTTYLDQVGSGVDGQRRHGRGRVVRHLQGTAWLDGGMNE